MLRAVPCILVALLVSGGLQGQEGAGAPLRYEVSFPEVAHHEARISVVFPGLEDELLRLRMSRTSPGRYAIHEFAKNVYDVEIRGVGDAVTVTRPHPHGWDVSGHGGEVRVAYTVFGNRADGTYTGIDATHAHLNMPATFLWAQGLESRPIRVGFRPPPGSDWRVATQLEPTADPLVFTAPDLDYFLDSPTELSDHDLRSFTVSDASGAYRIRIALHHIDAPEDVTRYVEAVEAIVREQAGVFGEYPRFDIGTYTFLADYLPWVDGDGMEHRNSTVLTSPSTLRINAVGLLGTVAHEFFHAWNAERLRPRSLEPFDFLDANENTTGELWFLEGFTSYYDDLTLRRAGLIDDRELARRLGDAISTVVTGPGRRFRSPEDMSRMAVFTDRAAFADPTNLTNTFISYYTWGSVVALALDLTLRSRYPGLDLDAYMRSLWTSHGGPFEPYDPADLETALARLTGDGRFAREFFGRYVRGTQVPDMEGLLARAGIVLRRARPGRAVLGRTRLSYGSGGARVEEATLAGRPLHRAGIDQGDRILAVDGVGLSSPRILNRILSDKKPGEQIILTVESRGRTRTVRVTLDESGRLEALPFEDAGRELTPDTKVFREFWLESRALQEGGR